VFSGKSGELEPVLGYFARTKEVVAIFAFLLEKLENRRLYSHEAMYIFITAYALKGLNHRKIGK